MESCVVSYVWLLLSGMFSRFIHVVPGTFPFLLLSNIPYRTLLHSLWQAWVVSTLWLFGRVVLYIFVKQEGEGPGHNL